MEKALIEFDSGELEIVSLSTLRKFDAAASLPVECICDWKSTGKKKATSYAVKVLRLGSSRKDLQPLMTHLLDGKDLMSWNPNKELGKGCRDPEPARKNVESDSDSDYVLPPKDDKDAKEKDKKAKATAATTADILAKIKARHGHLHPSESCTSTTYTAMQDKIKQLEKENANLRAALTATEVLPKAVAEMQRLLGHNRADGPADEERPQQTPTVRSMSTLSFPTSQPRAQQLSPPSSAQPSTDRTADDQVQTVIATALRRAQSGTKMAADIMHGLFTWEQMASHTIAGGNSSKAAFDPDLVQQIIDAVQKRFPDASTSDIKQAMRQKCSNAVKYMKHKSACASAAADFD